MDNDDFVSRRQEFLRLHESGCFVIPNPWDVGTARYLQRLGFPALATTSAGFAFSQGLSDGAVSREAMLQHFAAIARSVSIPVNADFSNGYADQPEHVAENVRLCVETGVAGLSIEDATGYPEKPLYDLDLAVERIRAAREAIDKSKSGVLLTARAECYLVHHPDPQKESLRRLEQYAAAGADVLYAPGPQDRHTISEIVAAVGPKPVNVLMGSTTNLTVKDLAELGVRRVSVGSALARTAWAGFQRAAQLIAAEGKFSGFEDALPFGVLNSYFKL